MWKTMANALEESKSSLMFPKRILGDAMVFFFFIDENPRSL